MDVYRNFTQLSESEREDIDFRIYAVKREGSSTVIVAPHGGAIEPGTSEGDIYKPWVTEAWHQTLVREKVKMASIVQEIMQRHAPELKTSGKGPGDLVLPMPG